MVAVIDPAMAVAVDPVAVDPAEVMAAEVAVAVTVAAAIRGGGLAAAVAH